ncbi:hypothetical protein Tco_1375817 [Tanacetum coccineum]
MSHSTISIPSDSTNESVESSPLLVILSDIEAKVMAVPAILPEIAPEEAAVVASPTTALYLVIKTDPKIEPFEAPISPNYVPVAEPRPAQVAPPPPIQIIPTLPIEHASVRPSRKRCRSPPPASSIPPPDVPSPYRRLSLPQPDTSAEAIVLEFVIPKAMTTVTPVRRSRMVEARGWLLLRMVSILRGSSAQREISIARIESDEQEIETLHVIAMWAEAQVAVLQGLLGIAIVRIMDLEFRGEDVEDRLEQCELGWIHDRASIRRLEEHLDI